MIKKDTLDVRALLKGTTPGPWDFDNDWHRFPTIVGPAGDKLATVEKLGFPEKHSRTPRDEANAKLLTAAPQLAQDNLALQERVVELEEALRLIANESDENGGYNTKRSALDSIWNIARTALTKGAAQ